MSDTINVLLSGDGRSELVFPTLINSLNANTPRPVHVRICNRGFSREGFTNGKLKVEFIGVPEIPIDHRRPRLSPSNDRLLILESLDDCDRVLVLGWDQLILSDVGPLYDVDLEGNLISGTCIKGRIVKNSWPNLGKTKIMNKIVSPDLWSEKRIVGGSNVIDLEACRKSGALKELRSNLEKLDGEDHLAILATFAGRCKFVSNRWNVVTEIKSTPSPKILHYSGVPKPWAVKSPNNLWSLNRRDWSDIEPASFSSIRASFPIFLFANPRSGSSLFVRLLNRCKSESGARVHMNGEGLPLNAVAGLIDQSRTTNSGPNDLYVGKTFLSHYYGGFKNSHLYGADDFMRRACGASASEPYGSKEVNYGLYKDDSGFTKMLETLSKIPCSRFLFLTRDSKQVSKSMISMKDWWAPWRCKVKSIDIQSSNFKKAQGFLPRSHAFTYSRLLDYASFSSDLEPLGLEISQEDYDLELSRKTRT